jgi:hypothetical protein
MAERGAHLFIGLLARILKRRLDLAGLTTKTGMVFRGVRSGLGAVDRAMARRNLALANSAQSPSRNKSKQKRRRAREIARNAPASVTRGNQAGWSDLEQAFFDAAPPDEPKPQAELERFDDLDVPERHESAGAFGQALVNAWAAFRRLLFGPARPARPASYR